MITSYTLCTTEIDHPKVAVDEIMSQAATLKLKKNAIGIITCHYDYIENEIVSLLTEALPFPLIGVTTVYQAAVATSGLFELIITVLTSDDVKFVTKSFSAAHDEPFSPTAVESTYQAARACCNRDPALIFNFLSESRPITGDEYLRRLDLCSGNIPSFGVVASGENQGGPDVYVVNGGHIFGCGFAVLLLVGDVEFRMYSSEPLEKNLLQLSATVTAADGCRVKELNDQPAISYLKKNGMDLEEDDKSLLSTLPFYFFQPGTNELVGRTLFTFHDDFSLQFLAEVPVGATIRVCTETADAILDASRHVVERAVSEAAEDSFFFFASCLGRFVSLGLEVSSELDYVTEVMPPQANYLACYVGGEISPISQDGRFLNCFRNNSFICCTLR